MSPKGNKGKHSKSDEGAEAPTPFDRTSIDELIELASALLKKETTGAALARVGVHGDFTEAEEAAVQEAVADFIAAKGWSPPRDRLGTGASRDPLLLPLSITLARWVAGKAIPSIDGPEARTFLADRYFWRKDSKDGIGLKRPTLEECLWVARDLMADPFFWDECKKAGEGPISERFWMGPMRDVVRRVYEKYGLLNSQPDAAGTVRHIASGKIKDLDSAEAIEHLKLSNFIED